jgi:hypothetical protein
MKKISRRVFSGALLSASAAAAQESRTVLRRPRSQNGSASSGKSPRQAASASNCPARLRRGPAGRWHGRRESISRNGSRRCSKGLSEIDEWRGDEPSDAMDFYRPVRRIYRGSRRREGAAGCAILRLPRPRQGATGAGASQAAIPRAFGKSRRWSTHGDLKAITVVADHRLTVRVLAERKGSAHVSRT